MEFGAGMELVGDVVAADENLANGPERDLGGAEDWVGFDDVTAGERRKREDRT